MIKSNEAVALSLQMVHILAWVSAFCDWQVSEVV